MKGQEDRMVKRRVDEVEKRIGSFVWFKLPIKLKGFFYFFIFLRMLYNQLRSMVLSVGLLRSNIFIKS